MGRRGIHNEAAERLRQRLSSKISIDKSTARRLFTLIYALLARNALIRFCWSELGGRKLFEQEGNIR
ncbi:hypothetical protein ILFOPFJJ_06163 [Ensifer psoraleae]|nr:hypothetical protein [Sinorhizobium psoraleae]